MDSNIIEREFSTKQLTFQQIHPFVPGNVCAKWLRVALQAGPARHTLKGEFKPSIRSTGSPSLIGRFEKACFDKWDHVRIEVLA